MIFIERYPLKRCQGCVKLIASKVNCFLNINDLSEVQVCMSSNAGPECPHTKDGADHVPLIFLSSVWSAYLVVRWLMVPNMLTSYFIWHVSFEKMIYENKIQIQICSVLPFYSDIWEQI